MILRKALLIILVILPFQEVFSQDIDTALKTMINKSLNVSPKLNMLEAKKQAAENRIPQVSNLPDPVLMMGIMNLPTNSFSFTQEPMTGKVIGLSQAFPFPGKLGAAESVLTRDVEIIQKEIDDARNEIVKDVKQNYFELILVRKKLIIALENKKLLEELSKVVRAKYSVSTASQQNVIKVELEITDLKNKIILLNQVEAELIAKLNSLLLDDSVEYPAIAEFPKPEIFNFTISQLDSIAKLNRPYLLGLKLAVEKAKKMQKLAEYDYYPNFNLAVQYSKREDLAKTNTPLNDFFSVTAGITIPLNYGGKVTAKVDEAISMKDVYSAQFNSALQVLKANFGKLIADLNSLYLQHQLLTEGKIQQAEKNYSSALSGYQVGNVDFVNVTDALKTLFDIETEIYTIKTKYVNSLIQLEFLTGTDLTKII